MNRIITLIVFASGLGLTAGAQAGPYHHPGHGKPAHAHTVTVHHHRVHHHHPAHKAPPRHRRHHYHAPRAHYYPPVRRATYVIHSPPPPPPRVGVTIHFGY